MPEGDTVWLAARRLHDALAGQVLTGSQFRVPQLAGVDLAGRRVREVTSRGKHLLTRLDDDRTLHTHFRMEGSWHLYRPGSRWGGGPRHEVRVVLENARWQAVGYRLPVVELLPTGSEADAVGHLGPDLLAADWDEAEALRRLRGEPQREVGPALLDQRNLAGIGNLYKTEMLFLSGLTPWVRLGDVPDLVGLVRRGRRLMMSNRGDWHQTTTGSTRRGETHWVFERGGRACRRCGSTIRQAMQGDPPYDRVCYWCPVCQVGPAPGTSAAASSPA